MSKITNIAAFFRLRTWKLGLKCLLLHPMRSGLTVLGIFLWCRQRHLAVGDRRRHQ